MNLLARAALLGASTGTRTFTGFAWLTLTTSPESTAEVEKVLASPAVKVIIPLAAVGELVADKLPAMPARTQPPSFAGRVAVAALNASLLARRCEAERDAAEASDAWGSSHASRADAAAEASGAAGADAAGASGPIGAPGTEPPRPAEPTAVSLSTRPVPRKELNRSIAVAVAAASVTTLLGPVLRREMARAVGVDWVGAVLEDALAFGLAWLGARR